MKIPLASGRELATELQSHCATVACSLICGRTFCIVARFDMGVVCVYFYSKLAYKAVHGDWDRRRGCSCS